MKITSNLIRELIRECMQDMGAPYPVATNIAQPAQQQRQITQDPDGYEGRMAKNNLYKIAEYATALQGIIQDNENLEPWVEEKIAVAASMMDSVGHYLQYERMRGTQVGE